MLCFDSHRACVTHLIYTIALVHICKHTQLRRSFDAMDTDGGGMLGYDELRVALRVHKHARISHLFTRVTFSILCY